VVHVFIQRVPQRLLRAYSVGGLHDEADAILRGRLRDHHDVCAKPKPWPQYAAAMSGTPMMPVRHGNQCNVARRRDGLHALRRGMGRLCDFVPALCGSKLLRIHTGMPLSITGAASSDGVPSRRRMQLARLDVGNFFERDGIGDDPRVCRQYAVYVGPDDDFLRVERGAQNRRGKSDPPRPSVVGMPFAVAAM